MAVTDPATEIRETIALFAGQDPNFDAHAVAETVWEWLRHEDTGDLLGEWALDLALNELLQLTFARRRALRAQAVPNGENRAE